jgi:endo-1,4-beta-xylanase
MISFSKLVSGLFVVASVLAVPSNFELDKRQTITTPQTGTNNGYYYSFWTNGGGTVDYTNKNAGEYSVTWQNDGDFTGGKGWNPGSAR